MHLLQRTAIHLIFFRPFSIYIFRCIFGFFLYSFLLCAAYGPFASIGHTHLSIHPAQAHRIGFISSHCMSYPSWGFFSMLFYRVFSMLRFLSSSFPSIPASTFSVPPFRIYSRGFPVLYKAAVHSPLAHDAELEREGGVESGRLDASPLSLSLLPSDNNDLHPLSTMDITLPGCPDYPHTHSHIPPSPRPAQLSPILHPFTTFYDSLFASFAYPIDVSKTDATKFRI